MASRLLVDSLVTQVRELVDENNSEQVTDELTIIPSLNRAQDKACSILAKHYPEPLITSYEQALDATTQEYTIPEDAFEDRLEKVELRVNGLYYEVQRIDYRDLTQFETSYSTSTPLYYAVIGRKFRLVPRPSGAYSMRLWYMKDPAPLAKQQGKITLINTVANYVTVDTVGADLSTLITDGGSFTNVCDGTTGEIKCTLQIQNITSNRVTFRTSPSQESIDNLTVVGALPTTLSKGDYLTVAPATCISVLRKPFANFLLQYAVAEVSKKLDDDSTLEFKLLENFREDVAKSWSGREQTLRVKQGSGRWGSSRTRRTTLLNTNN